MRALVLLILFTLSAGFQPKLSFAQDDVAGSARKIANKVVPAYPSLARTVNLSGTVKLEVFVQPNGTVKSIAIKGGSPVLTQAAEKAVREWKWEKADHETTETVVFHFNP
jgi:TonB family protein